MTSPRYTPQQERALTEKSVSIALSAGAGCGKTFVLTRRFIGYLQPGDERLPLSSLVAITFTDKAAREMRDRVRAACLHEVNHCPPEQTAHWLGLLRELDRARISTIHSFCGTILRSHAIEAGLDPEFTTLEAGVADALLRQSIDASASQLLLDDDADFTSIAVDHGIEGLLAVLAQLVTQRQSIRFDDFNSLTAEDLAGRWRRWLSETGLPELVRLLPTFPQFERVQRFVTVAKADGSKLAERLAILGGLLDQLGDPGTGPYQPEQIATLLETLSSHAKVVGIKPADWADAADHERAKTLFEQLRKKAKSLQETLELATCELTPFAEKSLSWLRIARRAIDDYEQSKQQVASVDFDDLLVLSRDLLRANPTVRQALSRSIRVLMVDEFQDTDPVQAELVEMLCGKELTSGKLFLVGDQKQSIYRFRGADPQVFRSLKAKIPPRGQLPLTINFRSQAPILDFVNIIFRQVMGDEYEALQPSFADDRPKLERIEFLWATTDAPPLAPSSETTDLDFGAEEEEASSDDSSESSDSSGGKQTSPLLRKREADWIARRIAALLQDPTERVREKDGRWRRVAAGDITILFRALTNLELYEHALQTHGIDYYVAGGRAFFAQQEVFDIAHLCQFLDDPEDGLSLVGLLRSPFFCLRDALIQVLAMAPGGLTRSIFQPPPLPPEDAGQIRFAAHVLETLLQQRDHWPLAKLIRHALELTGYEAIVSQEFLGARKLANVQKAIELARQFDQAGGSRAAFVAQLRESIDEEAREELAATHPESSSVVRLMSIHQSKGLEFPVVFVADMNRPRRPEGLQPTLHPHLGALITPSSPTGDTEPHPIGEFVKLFVDAANLEEYQRLFYVAATRARDLLILSAGMNSLDEGKLSPWLDAVRRAFHLDTGLLKYDPLLGSGHPDLASPAQIPNIHAHHAAPVYQQRISDDVSVPKLSIPAMLSELELAQPLPWPEIVQDLPIEPPVRRRLSVSRLEEGAGHFSLSKDSLIRPTEPEISRAVLSRGDAELLGDVVHGVLETFDPRLGSLTEEDLRSRLAAWCRRLPATPSMAVIEQAAEWLRGLASSETLRELASARHLHRELEFSLIWPRDQLPEDQLEAGLETEIYGLIDVLLQDPEGQWVIIDYKTSRVASRASDVSLLEPYRLQLGTYSLAVHRLFGVLPDRAELVFMRPSFRKVVWSFEGVPVEDLEAMVMRSIDELDLNPART
ncbi:MAG: hypothetical protein C0478_10865 [Planctomyces sp.]|nr:hypothetical protein [Planctomyces sp.]